MNHFKAKAMERRRERLVELELELKLLRRDGDRRSSKVRERLTDLQDWIRGLKRELAMPG
jgi:hypothetical protein